MGIALKWRNALSVSRKDAIGDGNESRYVLAVSRHMHGRLAMGMRLCRYRNARAMSRIAKGTISNSHDQCILTDCGECARNDASGEQATRSLNIFVEWAIRTGSN